jgi:hypothetical protein
MIKIERLHYKDLSFVFGDPNTEKGKEQIKNNIITLDLPFPLNKGKAINLTANKHIIYSVIDALEEIEKKFGLDFIKKNGLDEFDGCWNHRKTRNGEWWSGHTWAVSIDFCAKLAGYGKVPMIPYQFVYAFIRRGFYWGGNWRYKDGMHFSAFDG